MILSHKTIYTNVLEKLYSQSHSSSGEQHSSFNISAKDRRYLEFQWVQLAKGIWDQRPMWDQSYCRVPSQKNECDSRLEDKNQFGLLGMEACSPVVSDNWTTERNARDRSICFQIKIYFSWRPDPLN